VDNEGAWQATSTAGILKPSVVMFGESIAASVKEAAEHAIDGSGRLLVIGTSLATYSAWRLARRAQERGMPLGILNLGGVRGEDAFFNSLPGGQTGESGVRVDMSMDEILPELVLQLQQTGSAPSKNNKLSRIGDEKGANTTLLQDMLSKYPNDIWLLSSLGRVHLQMGNIKAAAITFKQVENLLPDVENSVLARLNRGYISLSVDQYDVANNHFQAVIDKNEYPYNLIATNNKAICLLYSGNLSPAIATLEETINKNPEKNLQEMIVFNLCTLYDLKSDNSHEKKKSILNLVAKFASDSFDLSVLKLTP